jgi:hypothetical protein
MANTYTKIASSTVGSGGASTIDFTSIPATYTDLKVCISGRTTQASNIRDYFLIRFNSSTSGYNRIWLYGYDSSTTGTGTATSATYGFAGTINGTDSYAQTFGSADIYIPNYAGSMKKSFSVDAVMENNSTTTYMLNFTAGLWDNTAAITSITLFPAGGNISTPVGNFAEHTTAYLYGIKNS